MFLAGWGNNIKKDCKVFEPINIDEVKKYIKLNESFIFRGLGRSYGDSSIQPKSTILTKKLNKIIYFDKKKGLINVQAGISISEILKIVVKNGWFMPVTPGSKYISIGGMIAANCHGKNHHNVGGFQNFVTEISLLIGNKIIRCSKKKNSNLFNFVFGSMGLTGFIISCKFKLIKINSQYIYQEKIKTYNLQETLKLFNKSKNWEYSVAWIDTSAKKNFLGRSIFFRGKHEKTKKKIPISNKNYFLILFSKILNKTQIKINFFNNIFIKYLNNIYFFLNKNENGYIHYEKFFYQLDKISCLNQLYGKKGFISYQFWIPLNSCKNAIPKIFNIITKYKVYSFISVIKLLGINNNKLSFGGKGYTLVFDFPVTKHTEKMLKNLDKIVYKFRGQIYLAKDSRINKFNFFKTNIEFKNPNFVKFRKKYFKKYNSLQSERLGI